MSLHLSCKNGNSSVLSPYYSVCNSPQVYLHRCNSLPTISQLFSLPYEMDIRIPRLFYGIVQVSTFYGLRISELLRAQQSDVLPFDVLHVHGAKGSRDCQVYIPGVCSLMQESRKAFTCGCLWHYSYLNIWRAMRTAGFYHALKNHQNMVVTHYGRYRIANATATIHGLSSTSDVLRHRSKTSVMYYINQGVN
jgi:hypothetical protein